MEVLVPALGVLLLVVVLGLGIGASMPVTSFPRWSSMYLPWWGLSLVLAELQVGAPASAPVMAVVAHLGSSDLALVLSRVPSALVPFCSAVPPFREHPLP